MSEKTDKLLSLLNECSNKSAEAISVIGTMAQTIISKMVTKNGSLNLEWRRDEDFNGACPFARVRVHAVDMVGIVCSGNKIIILSICHAKDYSFSDGNVGFFYKIETISFEPNLGKSFETKEIFGQGVVFTSAQNTHFESAYHECLFNGIKAVGDIQREM